MQTFDVAIIGGGVIGLSIARSLALRGAGRIGIFDRTALGSEASFAAAGMLAPQAEADTDDHFFRFACRSRDLYHSFAEALRAESDTDVELDETGTLYLAFDEDDEEEIAKRHTWQSEAGLPVQRLSTEEARSLEPCINASVTGALRFPLDVQVENRRLLTALATSVDRLGVKIISGTHVESVRVNRDRLHGLETSSGPISSPVAVIAAGAWTTLIRLSQNGLDSGSFPRVEPIRGQMLCFDAQPRVNLHVIYSPRGYIVPRRDGRLLVGSTSEQAGFAKNVTAAGINSMVTNALEISRAIGGLPLRESWAGLRPRASDGLPVIGPYGGIDGVFCATGHYRNGILLAPITGELIAEAIVNNSTSTLIVPFSPNRFDTVSVS
ncbi:MAG: glycine oxidase ThiO [Pyrinomonadaceae bacterium]